MTTVLVTAAAVVVFGVAFVATVSVLAVAAGWRAARSAVEHRSAECGLFLLDQTGDE